ncbi:MAG: DNA/RNA nuclease SfsA [Candidatus Parvarchaeota archaeon]
MAKTHRPLIVFVVQRPDAKCFKPNYEMDIFFSKELLRAKELGVEILCFDCYTSADEIYIRGEIPTAF